VWGPHPAAGSIIVAFLADILIDTAFFPVVRQRVVPGVVLKWFEIFALTRQDILAAGGFDERFEFYGPEGKELTERLERRGCAVETFAGTMLDQIQTKYYDKVRHYRNPFTDRSRLTRREMHHLGMDIWRQNTAAHVTVANPDGWGVA